MLRSGPKKTQKDGPKAPGLQEGVTGWSSHDGVAGPTCHVAAQSVSDPIYEEELEAEVLRAEEAGSGGMSPTHASMVCKQQRELADLTGSPRQKAGGLMAKDQRDTGQLGARSPTEPRPTCLGPAPAVALVATLRNQKCRLERRVVFCHLVEGESDVEV